MRDRFEAELVQTARESNVFTLGICRTMQLTNAIGEGGVMGQDLLSHGKVGRSHVMMNYGLDKAEIMRWPEEEGGGEHLVHARGELAEIFGNSEVPTNSIHHQWVQKAASDLEVVGWVHDEETGEDVIEATRRWNMMLVQFHPEYRPDSVEGKALLGMLGRSWAFYFADQLEAGRGAAHRRAPPPRSSRPLASSSSDADRQWLNEELAPPAVAASRSYCVFGGSARTAPATPKR
ncbi:MAG: gamma-glutamyl-gamma-aminobutyrate hydrolase family protein [Archangiaceae bacterium]|nr:gamma-glutamyl-gamma-aminobutyrate hydrolase family protein [Archangiaceae bacterium]